MSTVAEEVQQLWEHNKALFPTPPSSIQVQRAGSHYKARFDGEATCCFGDNPQQATKRVKFVASES